MSYGKIVNNNLIMAGNKIKTKTGEISNPSEQQYLDNGYKKVIFEAEPEYNIEEEKLQKTYVDGKNITVKYEKITLTDEEHNSIIRQEIAEEEAKITIQDILDVVIDKDSEALERIQAHRAIIVELRTKIR